MTHDKLPGLHFGESVINNITYDQEYTPLFIVQTSTAIEGNDNQIVEYANYKAFETIAKNKGLQKTLKYIEDILMEADKQNFYVYSIKTDTAIAFTEAIDSSAHLTDVTDIIYIEETKSTSSNTINEKITAIKNGVNNNAEDGVFREAYIIPYGTFNDAVTNAENITPEAAAVTIMTTITSGEGNGRICYALPDSMAGIVVGHCVGSGIGEEPGLNSLGLIDLTDTFHFDKTQMLSLQNMGVLFVREERYQGVQQYRINIGITSSFKESAADGFILSRTIVDEILRRIAFEGLTFIKAKESESNRAALESVISGIINEFITNEYVYREGTSITVTDGGNSTFYVTGNIKPMRSVMSIEVNTTITA